MYSRKKLILILMVIIPVSIVLFFYFAAPIIGFYIIYPVSEVNRMQAEVNTCKRELSVYKIKSMLSYQVGLSTGYVESSYVCVYLAYDFSKYGNSSGIVRELLDSCRGYIRKLNVTVKILDAKKSDLQEEEVISFITSYEERVEEYMCKMLILISSIESENLNESALLISELAVLKDIIIDLSTRIT